MFDFQDNVRKPKPLVPNAETVAAMRAAQRGDVKSFKSIDALMKDLGERVGEMPDLKEFRPKDF